MADRDVFKQREQPICTICNFDGVLKYAGYVARSANGLEWFECEPGAHAEDANPPEVRTSLITFDDWSARHGLPNAFK